MSVRPIRVFGDPVLRAVTAPIEHIDDGVRALMAVPRPVAFFRHVVTNMRVGAAGPDQAASVSYVTVSMHDGERGGEPAPLGPPVLVGRYQDELRREGGPWLLSDRRVAVDFRKS